MTTDLVPCLARRRVRFAACALGSLLLAAAGASFAFPAHAEPAPSDSGTAVAELRDDARRMKPLVRSKLARDFLEATASLPHVAPRAVLFDSSRTHYYWESEADTLSDAEHAKLITRNLD